MADTMIRGMAANKQVRFFACNSTDTVEKARITHHTSPVVTNALGRLLTGGVLMGAVCKNDTDKLTLRIQCRDRSPVCLSLPMQTDMSRDMSANRRVMLPCKRCRKGCGPRCLKRHQGYRSEGAVCRRHPSGKRRDCRGSDLLFCNK